MRGSRQDLPVTMEMDEGSIWQTEWGGMSAELGTVRATMDLSEFFKGLPDDRCQCPHWGYVVKGRLRYKFADREEVYNAGDAYYVSPGHTPTLEEGLEYVEFSPADKLRQTMEVVEHNIAAAQQQS